MLTTCTIQYLLASLSYFNHPNSLQYVFLPFLQLTYLFLKTKSAYCIDGTVWEHFMVKIGIRFNSLQTKSWNSTNISPGLYNGLKGASDVVDFIW